VNVASTQSHFHAVYNDLQNNAPTAFAGCAVSALALRFFGPLGFFACAAAGASLYLARSNIQKSLHFNQNLLALTICMCIAPFFGTWGIVLSASMATMYALKEAFYGYKVRVNLEASFRKIDEIEQAFKDRASERQTLIETYTKKNDELNQFWQDAKQTIDTSHEAFTQETEQLKKSIEDTISALSETQNALQKLDALTCEYNALNEKIQRALENNTATQALIEQALKMG
jgi:DNA repair exonuclease SbcCD ATPase subunit